MGASENIFYITEYWKMDKTRVMEIVGFDCEGYINGDTTGIFQYKTGQECTQKFMALQDEYNIEFDKISKKVEFVD